MYTGSVTVLGATLPASNETMLVMTAPGQASQPPRHTSEALQKSLTFEGKEGFFVKGSEVNGSFFVCFLKKSSLVELWNGSLSLKGSPPNGSGKRGHN